VAYGTYVAQIEAVSVSGAITLVEVTAGTNASIMVTRCWCSQSSSTTSAQQRIQILRKTATVTGTAHTPRAVTNGSSASAASAKNNASAEGTDGNILYQDTFNVLQGWLWLPSCPEERIVVPGAGLIAIKFPAAPGSAITVQAGIEFIEIG